MFALLLVAALAALFLSIPGRYGLRERFLRAAILWGTALLVATETLSLGNAIRTITVAAWWVLVTAFALTRTKGFRLRARKPDLIPSIAVCMIIAVLALTAIVAAWSPPNSADAMAYHMPRVIYWVEQSSVRFFPTQYLNQIMLQPMAEYVMLHLYILSGGDRLTNAVQWFGWFGCIVAVSVIARRFGADARAQAMTAVFAATIPSGVLAATGAKNDCLLSFWMATSVYLALSWTQSRRMSDAMLLGAAVGLSIATKATAYLFLPWFLVAVFARAWRSWRSLLPGAVVAGGIAVFLNAPQYVRNFRLSGSVLGFDSAQADGVYRWRNERFGWKETVSNALRNASEQLGMRSALWNQRVYDAVVRTDAALGIDPQDPATTWPGMRYAAPKNANHEADSPNAMHLGLLIGAICILFARTLHRRHNWLVTYAAAVACGFLAFCAYLKWQPFMARLFIPLFVLASPLVGLIAPRRAPVGWEVLRQVFFAVLCFVLLDVARHPLLDNWVRPLRGPGSVVKAERNSQYFADMTPWHNASAFTKTVAALTRSECQTIGLDITDFQLEYPLQALLLERNRSVTFIHVGVDNPSRGFAAPVRGAPCAVVCLECATDLNRVEHYRHFAHTQTIEHFVLFWN
jgi:hypothetical protein